MTSPKLTKITNHDICTNRNKFNRRNNSQLSKSGFTLIEVTLAMFFISVMLVTLAIIIYNVTTIYQKGLSMRAVNSTGRELVDEFSRAITNSPTIPLSAYCEGNVTCVADNAHKYIYQQHYGNVRIKNTETKVPIYGAFCSGRYSYIWNTGYALNQTDYPPVSGASLAADYTGGGTKVENFRLLKVLDTDRKVCSGHVKSDYTLDINNPHFTADSAETEEILDNSEDKLVLYDAVIFRPTQHSVTLHSFYSGTFILGTYSGSIDITGNAEFCKDKPDGLTTDFTYCAINKFNFAMRSEGQLKTGEGK